MWSHGGEWRRAWCQSSRGRKRKRTAHLDISSWGDLPTEEASVALGTLRQLEGGVPQGGRRRGTSLTVRCEQKQGAPPHLSGGPGEALLDLSRLPLHRANMESGCGLPLPGSPSGSSVHEDVCCLTLGQTSRQPRRLVRVSGEKPTLRQFGRLSLLGTCARERSSHGTQGARRDSWDTHRWVESSAAPPTPGKGTSLPLRRRFPLNWASACRLASRPQHQRGQRPRSFRLHSGDWPSWALASVSGAPRPDKLSPSCSA